MSDAYEDGGGGSAGGDAASKWDDEGSDYYHDGGDAGGMDYGAGGDERGVDDVELLYGDDGGVGGDSKASEGGYGDEDDVSAGGLDDGRRGGGVGVVGSGGGKSLASGSGGGGGGGRHVGELDSDEEEDDDSDDDSDDEEEEDGALPEFASEENRALDAAVKEKERRLEGVAASLAENKERIEVMSEHLRNVQRELQHTQRLLEAKERELESERHLGKLSERELGRCRDALAKLERESEEIQDALSLIQNGVFKGNQKMDRYKLEMGWNQDELEQWALAAKQKEEDHLALEKYTRADEAKVLELTLQIEKLAKFVTERKADLDAEVTETQAKQIELDKTAEEFRALHRERQVLVRQWKEAIEAMKRRDAEIAAAGERFAAAKAAIKGKEDVLAQHASRLKMQQGDNAEVESKISMKERVVARLREEFGMKQGRLQEYRDEVDVLKNELAKAAADLLQKRVESSSAATALLDKKALLEAARARYQAVKRSLDSAVVGTDRVEAAARVAEEELKTKETTLRGAERELDSLKEAMFKASQELFRLRQEEANLIAEISGAQAASRNLSAKIHKLDQQSLRQQELIYNAEFQIQQLERRVARVSGERTDEEKKVLNAKIEELTQALQKASDEHTMLSTQVKKLSDELRATRRVLARKKSAHETLKQRISELELENDSATQSLRAASKEEEEDMVKHDLLKLEVRRLRETMSGHADDVFALKNREFQLKMSMEERRKEISVHRDVQRAMGKAAEDERHKVAMELRERNVKVDKLKAKFETLVKRSAMGSEEGEEKSQVYYVIKAAQRREELQREGDELDTKIRKAEQEVRALENMLKHLNEQNHGTRTSYGKADMEGKTATKVRALEEKCKASSDALFKKKKELQRMQAELEEDQRRLVQIRDKMEQLEMHTEELRAAREATDADLAKQREQLDAAVASVEELSLAHRHAVGVGEEEETLEEKHFRALATKETNRNVLYTLGQLALEFPQIEESLRASLERSGLSVPSRPPSAVSSRISSRRSAGAAGGGMVDGDAASMGSMGL
eukprot:PLAT6827.3.p1 GENE.PLAT6827.3~~PLAT6827.3.p1  ORF type:complete len:1047 (-),score=734.14 PLAT6827.3:146-3259(-)